MIALNHANLRDDSLCCCIWCLAHIIQHRLSQPGPKDDRCTQARDKCTLYLDAQIFPRPKWAQVRACELIPASASSLITASSTLTQVADAMSYVSLSRWAFSSGNTTAVMPNQHQTSDPPDELSVPPLMTHCWIQAMQQSKKIHTPIGQVRSSKSNPWKTQRKCCDHADSKLPQCHNSSVAIVPASANNAPLWST